MSDTTFYLRSLFLITSMKSIPRELRCVLVGSQSKTALVILKVVKGPTLLSARASEGKIEKMSDTTFYLRSLFLITSRKRIPRELRCVLVGSQSKTALVILKVVKGPTLLSARASEGVPRNSNLK
ncbi:hypothetical protein V1478_009487 [Vespula squamosa]|uniref:Ribosomal protein L14 n=1 Tax=Vespula squamosa TaxID=30214 RepID=A0ABD2APS7_VESSQ